MLLLQSNNEIKAALTWKVENCKNDFKYGVSYFLKDNKYSVFSRELNKDENILLTLDNIYDIKKIGISSVIFDTDSTFYYINLNRVSKKQNIGKNHGYFRPCIVEKIATDKISIKLSNYSNEVNRQAKNRTLIYLIDKDELIQN